jgi:hypothetical protein
METNDNINGGEEPLKIVKQPKKSLFKAGNMGRPKGAINKVTPDVKLAIKNIIEERILDLNEDLDRMSPANRWNVLLSVMKFAYPTLSATKIDADIQSESKLQITISYEDDKNC